MDDKILVNGPINALRLEGDVNGTHKVIYLFGDYHVNTQYHTQCPSFLSEDFTRFLAKTIKKSPKDVTYDLFFETGSTGDVSNISQFRGRYIDEMYRYFKTNINIVNDKNIGSKGHHKSQNLRLHYIDIRDYLKTELNNLINSLDNIMRRCHCNIYVDKTDIDEMLKLIENIKSEINLTKQHFVKQKKLKRTDKEDIIAKLIDKILHKYDNDNVKNVLLNESFLMSHIYTLFDELERLLNELAKLITDYEKILLSPDVLTKIDNMYFYGTCMTITVDFTKDMIKNFFTFSNNAVVLYAYIVDMYFMRRFLDKEYVNHAIVYTGILHSINYAHLLTKHYNFVITHVSYSVYPLDKLNDVMKTTDDVRDLDGVLMPNVLLQCSDMSNFPESFL
jgi:hypothetical protein